MKNIVILISGRGSNMQAIVNADIPNAKIAAVIANVPDAAGLAWAKEKGIANGYDTGYFGPNDNILRQDFVKMLKGFSEYTGVSPRVVTSNSYTEKADATEVSSYASSAMEWAYQRGLIGQNSDLFPKREITRAEIAAVIARFERGSTMQQPGQPGLFPGTQPGGQQLQPGQPGNQNMASEPLEISESNMESAALGLVPDTENAVNIVMSDDNSQVKIDSAGTYIVSGSCADGNITVKKGTTGVVLILKDLDLTSTTGATVSCNKETEVKIIVEGTVSLTDAEDPTDETSEDAEVADAFDGAVIKTKAGSDVALTGSGVLNINGQCKNGLKSNDDAETVFVIDGDLTINIDAANDGINAGYDFTILSGNINVKAGDDGIHADRILTLGTSDGNGPDISITSSVEGLEGTVVNLFGGSGVVIASDDGINAANSDGTYSEELTFAINITGGTWNVTSGADGLDSNGNINITGGTTTIAKSANNGGDAGIDYDISCYIAEGTLINNYGTAGPDGGMQGGRF